MRAPYSITPTDQSGAIVITATLFMSWMCMVSLFRLYMRLSMNGPLSLDDLAAFIGGLCQAFGVGHVGAMMYSVSHGLGRLTEQSYEEEQSAREALYAADLLFFAGHSAAKISVCLLLRRLGRAKRYLLMCNVTGLATCVWALASILGIAISVVDRVGSPIFANIGWKVLTAFDVVIEATLLGLSIFLVWGIHMPIKRKAAVIFAFSTRISIIVLAIIRQLYINQAFAAYNNPVYVADAVIMTEVLLHCSLIAATIPCLKPFVASFDTGWGQGTARKGQSSYVNSGSDSHSTALAPRCIGESQMAVPGSAQSYDSHSSRQLMLSRDDNWDADMIEMDLISRSRG
ncbi:hypothetical protein BDV25DRAFT_167808 [Aspergillus avenaceus]|uniref:Rhodopsin domain-containing protein n=1 Tax=Aspergillus avenaceus TaxID=36643 RepID=A0A5N6U7L8_ASPAV|nr:hypothetical protein BDV25DRAFT_167808 [Aspergillus avenaceus]